MTYWTPSNTAILEELAASGHSPAEIAKIMKAPSRSSVLGKLFRLKNPNYDRRCGKDRPIVAPKRAPNIREADRRAALTLAAPEGTTDTPEPERAPQTDFTPSDAKGIPAAVLGLHPDQCRYPVGETDRPDFHFCTLRKDGQSPYCAEHHRICLTPGRPPQPRHAAAQGPVNCVRAG